MIITEPYNTGNKEEWDEFVRHSKNATFLFLRDYMDYHSDRFRDSSLIFRDKNGIAGLLPANRRGNVLESHGGLTYGGILSGNDITTNTMLEIFTSLKTYCHENGINQLIYKCIPCFYHSTPSDEDLYALFRNDAVLVRREVSSLIRIPAYSLPSRKKYSYRKLLKSNMVVEESDRLEEFFELVQTRLSEKYRTNAVHSAEEMKLLKSRFPENIRFFSVICDDVMLGGALLYVNKKTVHVQYYGASDEGRKKRVFDLLNGYLLSNVFHEYGYFDMGHSTEEKGKFLNESLIAFKEGYGASAACYDTYSLPIP